MAIKLSQSLKQTQNLTMTPQLQQAIKLLTLTHLEVANLIAEEMTENPMLEEFGNVEDSLSQQSADDYKLEKLEMENKETQVETLQTDSFQNQENSSSTTKDEFDWQTYVESFDSTTNAIPQSASRVDLDDIPSYENIVSRGMTLAEHLDWQLRMDQLSEDEYKFALKIIHNINDDGYLDVSFEELIAESALTRNHAYEILRKIQKLDPVGCGAENLSDCLLVQAQIMEERSPLLEMLIKNHLQDLKVNDFKKIERETKASISKIKETALLLQHFNPRPGRIVASSETEYVVPDIYVQEVGGDYVVKLNDEGVPRLRVSKLYKNMLEKASKPTEKDKEYIQDRVRSAMWLIKSIQNRQRTIVKVAKSIIARQKDFFKKGPRYLRPMVLKDVADEIGMHESTVSRVTTNKYMHTPIGLFELKYFFNAGLGGKDGGSDDVASEVLKIKIKELIEKESPKRPLSDQKISELLAAENLQVARRTVAKYRENLGILTSAARKRKVNL